MFRFPSNLSEESFEAWMGSRENWEATARNIAQASGFIGADLKALGNSTNLVIDLDQSAILKVFPPVYNDQFVSEQAALKHLNGKLSVAIPQIISSGEPDGWAWLILSRLPGLVGSSVWPQLTLSEKSVILHDVGRLTTEVHRIPIDGLEHINSPWPDFIETQIRGCVDRHRRQGLQERFLTDLEQIAADAINVIPLNPSGVILTGDWIPQNFLLSDQTGHWRISGLIDFGDVRIGWHEYDFLAPSALMCEGIPQLVVSLFEGYGVDASSGVSSMRRRLLTLMALHAMSDFRNMAIPDWEGRASNLFDLENLIWPTEQDCANVR